MNHAFLVRMWNFLNFLLLWIFFRIIVGLMKNEKIWILKNDSCDQRPTFTQVLGKWKLILSSKNIFLHWKKFSAKKMLIGKWQQSTWDISSENLFWWFRFNRNRKSRRCDALKSKIYIDHSSYKNKLRLILYSLNVFYFWGPL